ncbi:MAG: hypothetical protein WC023_06580 [Rhodocyclaceae bacterium]
MTVFVDAAQIQRVVCAALRLGLDVVNVGGYLQALPAALALVALA